MPVAQVVDFIRAHAPKDMHGGGPASLSPVVVQEGDSVTMAVQLLAASHLHHVYIVNEHRVPVGVLSVSDVVRALVWCMDP